MAWRVSCAEHVVRAQGAHPSWHCAELLAFEVAPHTDSAHAQRFPCARWLSPDLDGGLLERDVFPEAGSGTVLYEVRWAHCSPQSRAMQHGGLLERNVFLKASSRTAPVCWVEHTAPGRCAVHDPQCSPAASNKAGSRSLLLHACRAPCAASWVGVCVCGMMPRMRCTDRLCPAS